MRQELEKELRELYSQIYGEKEAEQLLKDVDELIKNSPQKNTKQWLTQKDAVLITYGDSIIDKEEPGLKVLNDFLKNGPTAQEVQEAKAHLMSGFVMNLDGNQKILDLITMIGAYDLPLDYLDTWTDKIQSVTIDDVRAAFNRKLSAEKMTTVVVGN